MGLKVNHLYGIVESVNEDGKLSTVDIQHFGSIEDTSNLTNSEQWFDNYIPTGIESHRCYDSEKLIVSVVVCVENDPRERFDLVDNMLKEFHCSYKFVAVETFNKKTVKPFSPMKNFFDHCFGPEGKKI